MKNKSYDVVILGSGPAGLQAAIHAARRKVSVLVLGRLHRSSAYGAHIENYYCVNGETGAGLLEQARHMAGDSGAELAEEDATRIHTENSRFQVTVENGEVLSAGSIILAMGTSRKKLGLEKEKTLLGLGVSYCVDCDGGFFKGERVAITGCGSAAVTGALTLMFYAREVHLVCEALDVSGILAQKLKESDIRVHEGRRVTALLGDNALTGLILDNGTRLDVTGLFIELGALGAVSLAGSLGVALDAETGKYIRTNKKQETNIPGIYAAGDICGPPWQVAKSVGEGCVAGLEAAAYAKKQQ